MKKVAILALLLAAGVSGAAQARELNAAEKEVIADAVRDQLKDPDSAQFKWGELKSASYCGLVNAKNAYGGYTGFSPFMVFTIEREGAITGAAVIGLGGGETGEQATLGVCASEGYGDDYFYSLR